ncbi:hypothetical protein ACQEVB_19220 [Pseudonocardia sp. CA-107938]|uniref:hypothetical protein n=1 Tax=Pseudonocardia sp. CA-107938 TaxID=3240021 RepID=UPI003D8A1591
MRAPAVVAAALAAVTVAGCAITPGTAVPAGQAVPLPATSPAAAPAPDGPGTCRIEAGTGSVSMRGGSGRVSTVNGVTTLTCGSGPPMTIAAISADGVEVRLQGGPSVTLRPGPATPVGPYTVTVDGVSGGKATMRVTPPR